MIPTPASVRALGDSLTAFTTDPDAPEGSYAQRLHLMKDEWNRSRGSPSTNEARFTFEQATSLLKRAIAPLVWLIFGFLPEKSVIVIAGEPKTSKTWLALTMALAISVRNDLFGVFRVPGSSRRGVAYFALEDSERSFRTRLAAIARGMDLEPLEAVEHVQVKCRASLDLLNDADLCGLAAACPANLELLIIDPLRDAHTAEENSSGEMAEVMRRLRFLRDTLGCSVLFVHHSAKSSPDRANRRPGQLMRGSSAVHGAVDGGVYLQMTKASEDEWVNTVQVELKAGKGAGTFSLTLNVEDDDNGEAHVARWSYSSEPTAKGQGALEANVQRLVELLSVKYGQATEGKRGMNREDIRAALGLGMLKASAAVTEAIRLGLACHDKTEGGTLYVQPEQPTEALQ